uniref:Uncharacterized protein n=1 Tax=Glossina austeni TaxID=7395 RepID=A0A1A9UE54_GLOAU
MSQIIFAVDVFYFLGFVGGGGVGNGHTGWGVMSAVFYINLFTLQRHNDSDDSPLILDDKGEYLLSSCQIKDFDLNEIAIQAKCSQQLLYPAPKFMVIIVLAFEILPLSLQVENIFVDSGRGRRDCPSLFEVSKMLLGSGRLNFIGRGGRLGPLLGRNSFSRCIRGGVNCILE